MWSKGKTGSVVTREMVGLLTDWFDRRGLYSELVGVQTCLHKLVIFYLRVISPCAPLLVSRLGLYTL
jgi:hypothetical protein